jgi:hypothetical protein
MPFFSRQIAGVWFSDGRSAAANASFSEQDFIRFWLILALNSLERVVLWLA